MQAIANEFLPNYVVPQTRDHPNTHPKSILSSISGGRTLRSIFWHAMGSVALALMLIVQPVGAGALSRPAERPAHIAEALGSAGAPLSSQFFSVTGRTVQGAFLATFNRFGLSAIGYPLSDERQEGGRTVQYFERVRMEYHPETTSAGFPVLMTRLGADLSKPAQPFPRVAAFAGTKARAFFAQTGHSLAEPFLSFWKQHGGVELFGYPLSEQMLQDGLKVQWFERARFEYHPELQPSSQQIQLTLLGSEAYSLTGAPPVTAVPNQPVKPAPQPAQKPPAAQPAQPTQSALSADENYLFASVNEQRAAAGLVAVQIDPAVVDVARSRSNDMAQRNYFSHTTPEGLQFFSMLADHKVSYKYAGEILARNNYPDSQAAQVAIQSYLNSAPHRAIMLDGRYNRVGVGHARSADGMHYYTIIFVQQ